MKPCIICGAVKTEKWSMNRGRELSIVDLCAEHEAPLLPAFRVGQVKDERPIAGRTPSQRVPRKREEQFQPLEWTPPSGTDSST